MSFKPSILPTPEEFRKLVRECEQKYRIENRLYLKCVQEFEAIQPLSILDEKQANRVIRAFLATWGQMQRRLGSKKKSIDGIEEIRKKLVDLDRKVQPFRRRILFDTKESELAALKPQICDLYKQIRGTHTCRFKVKGKLELQDFGPTGAAKVLHLCCPNFFPPWDRKIRRKLEFDDKEPEDYFHFTEYVRSIWRERKAIIDELRHTEDTRDYPIGMIDECLWQKYVGSEEDK